MSAAAPGPSPRAVAPGTFLTADPADRDAFRRGVDAVLDALLPATSDRPWSGTDVAELAAEIGALEVCPPDGLPLGDVLDVVGRTVLANGVQTTAPRTAAHLHCPTLVPAVVSELATAATNQSLDSFDQAPAATLVEDHLVGWFARLLGLPVTASGVLTSGGTASNLLGLTLARDRAARRGGVDVRADGLPPDAPRWRVLASADAHHSVAQAAAVLGLGRRAVVPVDVDDRGRMVPQALDAALDALAADDLVPIAIVATAGTTDLGAIDPLRAVAARAADSGAWLHVDAAVGGALALSERLAPLLDGLDLADSVTVDLHKLWWQPIGASVLLARREDDLVAGRVASPYLDRPEDAELNLVARSLDTSRRFDALKVLVALRSTGRRRLAAMVEHVVDLATATAGHVEAHPELELVAPPSTVTVVFRWQPPGVDPAVADGASTAAARRLFASGRGLVGRTRHRGRVALKLTLTNPLATADDLAGLLADVADVAAEAGTVSPTDVARAPAEVAS